MALAGALASSAAAHAAGPVQAVVPVMAAGPLVLSPRPRSEWELDPAKITIDRRLAVGGFGEVFAAKYEGTLVAVKRLLASDSGRVAPAPLTSDMHATHHVRAWDATICARVRGLTIWSKKPQTGWLVLS